MHRIVVPRAKYAQIWFQSMNLENSIPDSVYFNPQKPVYAENLGFVTKFIGICVCYTPFNQAIPQDCRDFKPLGVFLQCMCKAVFTMIQWKSQQ